MVAHHLGIEEDALDWDPKRSQLSPLFLDHLLATNDVRIAVTLAAARHGFKIVTWLDEQTLKSDQMKDYVTLTGPQGGEQKAAVVPDGYFALHAGDYIYDYFLEIDRRTVTREATAWGKRDWARKVSAYLAYYHTGQYQKRYQTKSLRILTVTTGDTRLANLKATTEAVGGKSRFWFTTFALATPERILTEPIWQVAGRNGLRTLTS